MTMLQVQARALGDPTRHEIFRFIDAAGGPVTIAEPVEHLGINHTAVRQHLAKLIDARLVVSSRVAPTGRGRPRFQYEATPSADSRWGVAEGLAASVGGMTVERLDVADPRVANCDIRCRVDRQHSRR